MTASGGVPSWQSTVAVAPAPETYDDLWQLAEHILAKVVEVYARNLIALPDRQYISVATPAQDCEQVTVAFQQAYIGPPGDEASTPQQCESPRSAVYQVVVTRCVPVADERTGQPPAPEVLSASARELMQDAWLLLQSSKDLDDYLGLIATVESQDAEGGLASTMLTVTLGVS